MRKLVFKRKLAFRSNPLDRYTAWEASKARDKAPTPTDGGYLDAYRDIRDVFFDAYEIGFCSLEEMKGE